MAIRNLYRQARPFRVLGWALFALVVVSLPASGLSAAQLGGALALALIGCGVLDLWRVLQSGPVTDRQVLALQLGELLLVPLLLVLLELPWPLTVGALGALVNANVALGGVRGLLRSCVAIAAGFAFALMLPGITVLPFPVSTESLQDPNGVVWFGGAVLLLVFSVALSDVGFRLTQKLDNHRRQWQERVDLLQPFVPQGLAERSPDQERRWMTVTMIDLVEFTARSSPLPPEVVGTVLDDLLDAVVQQANRAGGTLDKFMGDGALLFFAGHPTRAAAVHAASGFAVDLLRRLTVLNARWHGYGVPEPLQLRIGIASGYCSLGQWGTQEVRAYTIVGACVGLAERLQSASQADSLAMCPVSARLLWELQDEAVLQSSCVPEHFSAHINDSVVEFSAEEEELRGFARMRVYRPSAKVRGLSA